jgi:hypothetical protein
MGNNIFFNKIYVIESLPDDEKKTGFELCNGILKYSSYRNTRISYEYLPIKTKEDLFDNFEKIENSIIRYNSLPYIHFEVHGLRDKTGLALSSDIIIKWEEVYKYLQSINIRCRNNLFISLATCYGAYMVGDYSVFDEPCPFYGYIGPFGEVGNIDLMNGYSEYFSVLLETRKFEKAIEALKNSNKKFHNQIGFVNYEIHFEMVIDKVRGFYSNSKYRNQLAKKHAKLLRYKPEYLKMSNNQLRKKFEHEIIKGVDNIINEWRKIYFMEV